MTSSYDDTPSIKVYLDVTIVQNNRQYCNDNRYLYFRMLQILFFFTQSRCNATFRNWYLTNKFDLFLCNLAYSYTKQVYVTFLPLVVNVTHNTNLFIQVKHRLKCSLRSINTADHALRKTLAAVLNRPTPWQLRTDRILQEHMHTCTEYVTPSKAKYTQYVSGF